MKLKMALTKKNDTEGEKRRIRKKDNIIVRIENTN